MVLALTISTCGGSTTPPVVVVLRLIPCEDVACEQRPYPHVVVVMPPASEEGDDDVSEAWADDDASLSADGRPAARPATRDARA
jgi:hypothetical protein